MAKKNYVEKKFSCVRDGLTIRGLLFEPVNGKVNSEGKLPVAIVSHMFMVNYKLTVKYARFLAENGYLSVCYDFNGGGLFSKSDGKSVNMSVLTEVADLEAVIAAVLKHEKADASRLMLMGCSQGGFVSALVAAKDFAKQALIKSGADAVCGDMEDKKEFQTYASELVRVMKYLQREDLTEDQVQYRDAIVAIYKELQLKRKHADNTDLMVEINKAFNNLSASTSDDSTAVYRVNDTHSVIVDESFFAITNNNGDIIERIAISSFAKSPRASFNKIKKLVE